MEKTKQRVIAGGIRLPDSCLQILEILSDSNKGVTQKQLIATTGLSERAVKYALKDLAQKKLAFYKIVLNDTRRRLYYLGLGE